MPTVISCESCAAKLKVPDGFQATKVKCPKCRTLIFLKPASAVATTKKSVVSEDVGFERVEEDESPIEKQPKKRRRRRRVVKESSLPDWAPWAFGVGVLMAVALVAIVMIKSSDVTMSARGVVFAVLVPIQSVLLIISMFIASALGGGIDFGAVHTAIFKAVGLVAVVILINMAPVLWIASVLVWAAGLYILFRLDAFETGLLVAINTGLTRVLFTLLLALMLKAEAQNHMNDVADPQNNNVPVVIDDDDS